LAASWRRFRVELRKYREPGAVTGRSAVGQDSGMDLASLLDSWRVHLEAERKSPGTIKLYLLGVRGYLAWCDERGGTASLDRASVSAYVAGLLGGGAQAATARARLMALRRFSVWLVEEGKLPADPLVGLKPPQLDQQLVPGLSEDEIRRLLRACEGKSLRDRRDEAILRLLLETDLRVGECLALTVDDVDVRGGLVLVRRGKGGKGRVVPFGPVTGRALDRYLRLRRGHPLAHSDALWLGERGYGFGYDALHHALTGRGRAAGLVRFSPLQLRHTFSH
jgi:integrase/recombinase XerD